LNKDKVNLKHLHVEPQPRAAAESKKDQSIVHGSEKSATISQKAEMKKADGKLKAKGKNPSKMTVDTKDKPKEAAMLSRECQTSPEALEKRPLEKPDGGLQAVDAQA
jgi:hypothetical protein